MIFWCNASPGDPLTRHVEAVAPVYHRTTHIRPHSLFKNKSGMIVLVPLITITVLLIVLVVAGKVLYRPAPRYLMPTHPTRYLAASTAELYSEGKPVRHIEFGDTVWVVRAGNGLPVVFADSTGKRALGVAEVLLTRLVAP